MRLATLTSLICLILGICSGQPSQPPTFSGTTDPASCSPLSSRLFRNTTSNTTKYCSATNTWTAFITSSGSGTVSAGTLLCMTYYAAAGTTVDDTQNEGNCALKFDPTTNTLTGYSAANVALFVLNASNGSYTSNSTSPTRITMLCGTAPSAPSADNIVLSCTGDVPHFTNDVGKVFGTVASGTSTMAMAAIAANDCATTVSTTATGTASTDVIIPTTNADVSGITGYGVLSTDGLQIYYWPTTNTVNWSVCNQTGTSITPGSAIVINWVVIR